MPRYSTVFQVFVASPSDVAEERSLLEGVISQLNQIWSETLGIAFELVRWETNVHPSFSNDPQAAINEQIGLDYDVFIGIFWGRIGTITPRSASGTLEEFERAYARFLLNKTSPEIMIYFKDAAIQPSKIDTIQLQGVQTFRESLTEKGGLYSMFEDQAGFESSLRAHLSALAQKFSAEKSNSPTERIPFKEQPTHALSVIAEEDDDYGVLDYTEIYTSRLEEVNLAMNSIGSATVRLSEQLVQRAAEMQTVDKNSAKDVRRHAKRAADDMNNFAEVVRPQIGVMSVGREVAFDALSKALALQIDFTTNESDLLSLKNSLCSLISVADNAKIGTLTMRSATATLPRLSKELNIAKRAVVFQLDAVASEFDKVTFTLKNIVEAVEKMLGEQSNAPLLS
jgi:hypothetical protein